MKIYQLVREQLIRAPLEQVWAYFSNPFNLNNITPPDMNFEIVYGGSQKMYQGQLIEYRVEYIRGLRSQWLTEIAHLQEDAYFVDEQRIGPYHFWYHEHIFEGVSEGTKMTDRVTYALPFGPLGVMAQGLFIGKRLKQIFDYRTDKIGEIFE